MSIQLIQQYQAKIEKLIQYSGTRNESTLRKPIQDLLRQYALSENLLLVPEVENITNKGHKISPNDTLKDPIIREKFNTYKFADYKEHVIDLKCRVCTVNVETMKIIKEMEKIG